MSYAHKQNQEQEPQLTPRAEELFSIFATEYADLFKKDFLFHNLNRSLKSECKTREEFVEVLVSPYSSLRAFYGMYGFARRGKERFPLIDATLAALDDLTNKGENFELFEKNDGNDLWAKFVEHCPNKSLTQNENQNRGIIQGVLELAQEIYQECEGESLATWIAEEIKASGEIEEIFNRLVDIKGVGPKSASTYFRDIIALNDMEEKVIPRDRIYILPIDRWIRLVANHVIPENVDQAADWILAGKINKYARRAHVEAIRFNMGVTYFGQKVVKHPDKFEKAIAELS